MSTESAVKHTPGPWKVYRTSLTHNSPDRFWETYLVGDAQAIGHIATGVGATKEEAEANARLIAAAPAMLHLLEESIPQLRWGSIHGSRCDELIAEVEAAIKKAKGE